jgi:hypothetical protein
VHCQQPLQYDRGTYFLRDQTQQLKLLQPLRVMQLLHRTAFDFAVSVTLVGANISFHC